MFPDNSENHDVSGTHIYEINNHGHCGLPELKCMEGHVTWSWPKKQRCLNAHPIRTGSIGCEPGFSEISLRSTVELSATTRSVIGVVHSDSRVPHTFAEDCWTGTGFWSYI